MLAQFLWLMRNGRTDRGGERLEWEGYPVVSPEGRWFAFSRQAGGNWHIWIRTISSHAGRRLTAGACNSVTPAWLSDSKKLAYATDCRRG